MNLANIILAHPDVFLVPLMPDSYEQGDELIGQNPRRDDKKPGTFNINLVSGKWADFACQDEASGADPISFIAYCKNTSQKKVRAEVKAVIEEKGLIASAREQVEDKESSCIIPVPESVRPLGNPDTHSIPVGEWQYLTPEAELICLVRRYEKGSGKQHRTWTWHSDGQWKMKRPPKPWPLYNQQDFIDDDLTIYIAEGEKCAVAASRLLDGVGTCTLGGSGAVKDADLSLVKDRHIIILPDADSAGKKYAQQLIARLQGKVKSLRIVDVWGLGWSNGEDIADFTELPADWDKAILTSQDWIQNNKPAEPARKSQASDLVEIAEELDYFNADDLAYVDLMINGHRETWPLRSKSFRSYLARQYQLEHDKAPSSQSISDALLTLTGKALFECDTLEVNTRIAGHGDTIFIDMCNADWQAIKVTADGWKIVDDYPVRFIRRKGVHALPIPDPDGDARLLFNYINLHSEDEERLILAWLVQSLRPLGPYPLLIFQGEQGTAKTTACRVMVRLIDPKVAETRTRPRNEHDLLIAAHNGWVVSLDNLSGVPIWLSDALCRLATGNGFSARELFTDMEEVLIDVSRPSVLNGIDDVAVRPDLIGRSIILTLAPIAKEDRKPESTFWRHFDQVSGKILGGLLDGLSTAIREYPSVDLPNLPRMADFAGWATAAETSFGYQTGEFLKSFDKKRENAIQAGLDGSHLAIAIEDLIDGKGEWEGTLKALLADLTPLVDERTAISKEWPKTPRKLGGDLRRIATSFRELGVDIQFDEKRKEDGYHARITDNRTPPSDNKDANLSTEPSGSSGEQGNPEHTEHPEVQNTTLLSVVSENSNLPEHTEHPEVQNTTLLSGDSQGESSQTGTSKYKDTNISSTCSQSSDVPHPVTGDLIPFEIITDPLEAATKLEVMSVGLPLGADLETRPKPEYKDQRGAALSPDTGRARLLQVSDGKTILVIDLDQVSLSDLTITSPLIFHNASFDSAFLLDSGIDADIQCTQLAVTALTGKQRPSLAWSSGELLGIPVDKTEQVSDWSGELTADQYRYAALDAVLVHALHAEVQKRLEEKKLCHGNGLVQRCVRPIAHARHRGILLDTEKHQALVDAWTEERDTAKEKFIAIASADPESPKQLAEWLTKNLDPDDLKLWPVTGKGQLSTDKDTLKQFAHVPMVKPLLEYRHAGHRVKTWGENYRRHIENDGRIRPGFQLLGACTGRMSSNKPNVQQLPRDPAFRECLVAGEGHKLVAADYGQIELRTAGLLSGDNNILDAYRQGQDLHTKVVSMVTGKPLEEVTSGERNLGKALNFGLLYGAGAKTFRAFASANYGLDITLEEAEQYKAQFDKSYTKLRFWQLEQYRKHQQAGEFRTVGGRRCVFKDKRRCYTDSRNYPIQGAAADLQMQAIYQVSEQLTGKGIYLVNMVHDELILEVSDAQVAHVMDQLVLIMTDVFMQVFRRFPAAKDVVGGLVDVKSGNSYAEAK